MRSSRFVYLAIIVVVLIFFYPLFLSKVPFPGDLLVGAYEPWFINIAVKNPLISDVFSQFFMWKSLIADSFRSGTWPLWNEYSYAGYPLLANFNSGALNPLNIFMVTLGNINGWAILVVSQHLLMYFSMYVFLRVLKFKRQSSLLGGLVFAFNGFAISWSQFVNINFVLIWIPIGLWAIEKYKHTSKIKYLSIISPVIFLMATAGHFQGFFYGLIIFVIYYLQYLYKLKANKINNLILFIVFFALGLGLSAIQILPTVEMSSLSIRFSETYISDVNYGLLPFKNLITLLIPDYFGNPVTRNFTGFFNYHETVLYMGIIGFISIIYSILNFKDFKHKIFVILASIAFLLVFNNYLSKFLYEINFPILSTFAAGRGLIFLVISTPILVAFTIEDLKTKSIKAILKLILPILIIFIVIFLNKPSEVVFRNSIFPFLIFLMLSISLLFRKAKIFILLIIFISIFDLFRFFHKYTPFVDRSLVFPNNEVTEFIKNDKSDFRIEKTQGALMPPNTWAYYGIKSTSGYDSLAYKNYVNYYSLELNNDPIVANTRYSELSSIDPAKLGEASVKYLLSLEDIEDESLEKVFSTEKVNIYENKLFKDIFEISDGEINFIKHNNNTYLVNYSSETNSKMLIRITNYPGWNAYINSQKINIQPFNEIFMQVDVPSGDNTLKLIYEPKSFDIGLKIAAISLGFWVLFVRKVATKK